jgi:hypothetical protein
MIFCGPHGYCYMWNPGLLWLQAISDVLIARFQTLAMT